MPSQTADEVYEIVIPKWNKWQTKRKTRKYIAMDINIFSDPEVQYILATDPQALFIFQWLWTQADEYGIVKMRSKTMKKIISGLLSAGNRFKLEKRLELLSDSKLIQWNIINDLPLDSNDPLSISNGSPSISNEVLSHSEHPLEIPETQAALRATKDMKRHDITIYDSVVDVEPPPKISTRIEADGGGDKKERLRIWDEAYGLNRWETEDQWLHRQLVEQLTYTKTPTHPVKTLNQLLMKHPKLRPLVHDWYSHSPEERMCAVVTTTHRRHINNKLIAGLKYIQTKPEDYRHYWDQCVQCVEEKEFKVMI